MSTTKYPTEPNATQYGYPVISVTQGRCKPCNIRYEWSGKAGLKFGDAKCPICNCQITRTTCNTNADLVKCDVVDGKIEATK